MLAIAACSLSFAINILNALIDAVAKSDYPAFARFSPELVLSGVACILPALPIYLLATRSKFPLFWCFVSLAIDLFIASELKLFWLWKPAVMRGVPIYLEVRYQDIQSFLVFLAIYSLPLSRRFIVAGGALLLAIWGIGIGWAFLDHPGHRLFTGPFSPGGPALWRTIMDPEVLVLDYFVVQLLLIAIFTFFLALAIERGRRFVIRRVAAAAEVASLAKFFSPDVALRIVRGDRSLAPARRQVAILFADRPALAGVSALQAAQARFAEVEQAVFRHGGVMDRYFGGPAMAVFGALDGEQDAAARAMDCARFMRNEVDGAEWSIALHAGHAVCGDVGGSRSRVFSVIGDTVNAARRILDVAADRGGGVLISESLLSRLSPQGDECKEIGPVRLRGRDAPVELWSLER
jgi:adenylate cyclase